MLRALQALSYSDRLPSTSPAVAQQNDRLTRKDRFWLRSTPNRPPASGHILTPIHLCFLSSSLSPYNFVPRHLLCTQAQQSLPAVVVVQRCQCYRPTVVLLHLDP